MLLVLFFNTIPDFMKENGVPEPAAFKNTFCVFEELDLIEFEKLDFDFISKSGSCYSYSKSGMYRLSNHWGRLANSKWRLTPLLPETKSKIKLGFAPWSHFYPDNAQEDLYYIETDFLTNTVNYQHKDNPKYDKKAVLRTSFLTGKRIKQIRNLLDRTSWATHFKSDDLNQLRKIIIDDLMFTNVSLEEIKHKYNNFRMETHE